MSRIIIEYMPKLSEAARRIIRAEVTYSMISKDEDSHQYEITQCIEALEVYDDIYKKDLKIINELLAQNTHYLEF